MPDATHPPHKVRGSDRGRLVAFPGGHRDGGSHNNLPPELSSFVGREKELAEVRRQLEGNRPVTLTGSGGCGKTRLALAAAGLVVPPLVAGLVAPPAATMGTTFIVNSNFDFADTNPGDGICDISAGSDEPCTLRAAIQEADATRGMDTIVFDIPGGERDPSTGVATIKPQTKLPPIDDPVVIDGLTQPGSSPNTLSKGTNEKPAIQLDGSGVQGTFILDGLLISASDVTVRGLAINRFAGSAGGAAVFVRSGASNNRLEQNFIGTDPTGTQDLGNGAGVVDRGDATTIGAVTSPEAANLISGNDGPGVSVGSLASGTEAVRNLVGTDKTGTKRLGNSGVGVEIAGSSTNNASANTVAFNGQDGVRISDAAGSTNHVGQNVVTSISIFANGGPGINLIDPNAIVEAGQTEAETANDPRDADLGPNGLQNKPVLSSAEKDASGTTTVNGQAEQPPRRVLQDRILLQPQGHRRGQDVPLLQDGFDRRCWQRLLRLQDGQEGRAGADDSVDGDERGRRHLRVLGSKDGERVVGGNAT